MKRNFSNESFLNILFRLKKSLFGRLRGFIYSSGFVFHEGSSRKLFLGNGIRLINSKAMLFSDNVSFGICARIECHNELSGERPILIVGKNSSFGDYCHIGALTGVFVGENVLCASGVLIIDHSHGEPKTDLMSAELSDPKTRALSSRGKIVIEDNVWIGERVIVLSGSHIGEGAVIAANTVVRGRVPARSIYHGV
jgi:acetyltransferase-like isoleucine patch superfamily enzyme